MAKARLAASRPWPLRRSCQRTRPDRCSRGFAMTVVAPRLETSFDPFISSTSRNIVRTIALVGIGYFLEDDMKKIALLTASFALLASPVLAETAKTTTG